MTDLPLPLSLLCNIEVWLAKPGPMFVVFPDLLDYLLSDKSFVARRLDKSSVNLFADMDSLLARLALDDVVEVVQSLDCIDKGLEWSAARGKLEIIKALLACGPVAATQDLNTVMLSAAKHGQLEAVKLMLATDSHLRPAHALFVAAENGQMEVVKFLIADVSDNVMNRCMVVAAGNGHLELVDFLIRHGVPVDCEIEYFYKTDTPLLAACYGGYLDIVRLLLSCGANAAHYKDPLGAAASKGHAKIVELLLANGADVEGIEDSVWPVAIRHYEIIMMLAAAMRDKLNAPA